MGLLEMVKKERLADGLRFLFYGPEGVGKSTLAANAPNPIFIDCEDGTGQLEAARFPFRPGRGGHLPESLNEVYKAIHVLSTEAHDFKTLVIDTQDALNTLVESHVRERDSGRSSELNKAGKRLESIESYGYGKGYKVARDEWKLVLRQLDLLRQKTGMHIVLLGHSTVKLYKNPAGEDYDRFQVRIPDDSGGLIKGWCDTVGFVAFEEGGDKMDGQSRPKGWSTGKRLMHFEHKATYDAKTRLSLPAQVEVDSANPWGPLAAAIDADKAAKPGDLRAAIEKQLERIGDSELSAKVLKAISESKNDVAALKRYLNNLQSREKKGSDNE